MEFLFPCLWHTSDTHTRSTLNASGDDDNNGEIVFWCLSFLVLLGGHGFHGHTIRVSNMCAVLHRQHSKFQCGVKK